MAGRNDPRVIVMTGSECTGKTTLAATLALRYETIRVPESARHRVEMKGAPLGPEDVEPIALAHIAAADEARHHAKRLLILDTDLISTVVYARHYYGACPAWIESAARERRADLYLLHHPDVPWIADGAQRDRPIDRDEIHALFGKALTEFGASFMDIRGEWEERASRAMRAVSGVLAL